jgi:hypothetical protein
LSIDTLNISWTIRVLFSLFTRISREKTFFISLYSNKTARSLKLINTFSIISEQRVRTWSWQHATLYQTPEWTQTQQNINIHDSASCDVWNIDWFKEYIFVKIFHNKNRSTRWYFLNILTWTTFPSPKFSAMLTLLTTFEAEPMWPKSAFNRI